MMKQKKGNHKKDLIAKRRQRKLRDKKIDRDHIRKTRTRQYRRIAETEQVFWKHLV